MNKQETTTKKEANYNPDKIYACKICGLEYKEKKFAKKCERWCKEYKSCNLNIVKHSIIKQGGN